MGAFPKEVFGGVATIVAAIVTGMVALVGLIISKEQKVSEFRQQWIDALRADVAEVIKHGHCLCLHSASPGDRESLRQDFGGITEANARIRLRLNPSERESAALLKALDTYIVLVDGEAPDNPTVSQAIDALVAGQTARGLLHFPRAQINRQCR